MQRLERILADAADEIPTFLTPTEWQHIGNQIEAAFIFARADFVKVSCRHNPNQSLSADDRFANIENKREKSKDCRDCSGDGSDGRQP